MLTRIENVTVKTITDIRRILMFSFGDVKEKLHLARKVLEYYDES